MIHWKIERVLYESFEANNNTAIMIRYISVAVPCISGTILNGQFLHKCHPYSCLLWLPEVQPWCASTTTSKGVPSQNP